MTNVVAAAVTGYPGTSGAVAAAVAAAVVFFFIVFARLVIVVCLVARSRLVPKPQQRQHSRRHFCSSSSIRDVAVVYSLLFLCSNKSSTIFPVFRDKNNKDVQERSDFEGKIERHKNKCYSSVQRGATVHLPIPW